jgi:protein disulfide-isomerase
MNRRTPRPRRLPAPVAVRLSLLIVALSPAAPARAQVAWRAPFESARAEAAANARPLLVQFTGPWCVYCLRMDRETFARPDVAALAGAEFVPVKVRADERPDLMEHFGVSRLPTTIVLAPDGRPLLRRDGYADPGTYLALLAAARPPAPAPAPALALDGHDPVALVQCRGLVAGRPELEAVADGLTFRFADAASRDAFLADPGRYAPRGGGRCPVGAAEGDGAVAGDPHFGVAYRGRLYVCASEAARRRFAADPDRYAEAEALAARPAPERR